jgi:hypothetical protein
MVYYKKEGRNCAVAMVTAVYMLRWNTCIVAVINHKVGKIIPLMHELRFVAWSCNESQGGEKRIG